MSTILYPSPIFGPVNSRRLGLSLGINLLPPEGKICSFDCVYCECGLNAENRPKFSMPTCDYVLERLEERINELINLGRYPQAITFSGNGEPTGHPDFPKIVHGVIELRNRLLPKASVCCLTNATHLLKPEIFRALRSIDTPLLKLDTVSAEYIARVDRPTSFYDLPALLNLMKKFDGRCVIQTMFMTGFWKGQSVDNTTDEYVLPWVNTLKTNKPRLVTIYTLDREAPSQTLLKASEKKLRRIAAYVTAAGIPVTVSI